MILNRNSYGSSFNIIEINNNILSKTCFNQYGLKKMDLEKEFYNYILTNSIDFPMPNIINIDDNSIFMQYMENYVPLYKIYTTLNNNIKNDILQKIYDYLNILHQSNNKIIRKEELSKDLKYETQEKIYERIEDIRNIINKYDYIKCVNNMRIDTFENIMNKIKMRIEEYVGKLNDNKIRYFPIHGDCQFNNILYSDNENKIVFIDPRGYFGNSKIFGMKEYDYAKINFALSGYDEFDNREINNVDIYDENMNIDINMLDENILDKDNIITTLVISIWLGNAHCFKNNEYKAITSYFIAMYFATKYL